MAQGVAVYKLLTAFDRIFISHTTHNRERLNIEKIMTDLIYIGVVVLFFVVSGLYVRACDKM